MSPKTLKIALGLSMGLNLFLAAAIGAAVLVGPGGPPPRGSAVIDAAMRLDPPVRDRFLKAMRASLQAARPDLETARRLRRRAADLAGAETFDRAAMDALLAQARASELKGRRRLEEDLSRALADLAPRDRKAMAPALRERWSHRGARPPQAADARLSDGADPAAEGARRGR